MLTSDKIDKNLTEYKKSMNTTTVDPDEIDKFSKLSNDWWDKEGKLKTLHDINEARLQFIQKHATLKNQQTLDMGCGGGILTEALAKAGALTTGVDLSESAIQVAKQHASQQNLNINYLHCAIEDLDSSLKFDVITCLEMLEHVPDPETLLNKLCQHLKPNGKLFISTINRTAKAYLYTIVGAEYLLNIIPKNTHDYKKYIKPSELAGILRTNDLSIKELSGLHYNPLTRTAWLAQGVEVNYIAVAVNQA